MDVIEGDGMKIYKAVRVILFLAAILVIAVSCVNAECTACKSGSVTAQQDSLNKEWAAFLGTDNATADEVTTSTSATGLISPQCSILVPLDNIDDSEIILDISPDPAEYIPGAIGIPYTDFLLPGGALKTVSEMSEVLGKAGISERDSVLIYGECQPCGGGPSAATYVYWILKYLGHEDVKLLDGSIDDWVTAGRPTASSPSYLPSENYTPTLNSGLLASYEYVRSGSAQVIDARTATEFEAGSIPGSINMPYDRVLDGKRIKDEAALRDLFSSLDRNKPIVVYTNTGIKASMIWLALTLLDYDARVYSWMDWKANLPHLKLDEVTETFRDAMRIEVAGTSKYKNIGNE